MNIEKILFLLITLIIHSHAQGLTALGPNLLVNHDFSTPVQSTTSFRQFGKSILGWNCSVNCEIINCYKYTFTVQMWRQFTGDCPAQAIDTSSYFIEVISQ